MERVGRVIATAVVYAVVPVDIVRGDGGRNDMWRNDTVVEAARIQVVS
jgi:hypothetical protein